MQVWFVFLKKSRSGLFSLLTAFDRGICTSLDTLFWVGILRFWEGVVVVFLAAFCSRGGFHETTNKSWTSWWTEIVFCLLDFTVCFPSLVHSLFITLCSVSLGLCSLQ